MGKFCDSPMEGSEFYKEDAPKKGGAGTYNGCTDGAFGGYTRTSSPNAVPELTYDRTLKGGITGEPDQGLSDDIKK